CRYDAIVGVRRGGSIVCDALCRHLPSERYAARYDVTLQRPSTKRKDGGIGRLLKRLPRRLLDSMRIAEAAMLSLGRKLKRHAPLPNTTIPDGLAATLTTTAQPQILVIDDAIDSGDTLYSIVETLRKTNPDARISIAVITETTSNPRIQSNYTLYRNRTLIRFPWSNDYKEN
ncbi:MAG: phosphoribosyltransferase domain-containing protein, partial [Muribaculaceae bacterium]|nr:phosphoribosyltransferase domain-containing protein [Muribaculaceae bacterium]